MQTIKVDEKNKSIEKYERMSKNLGLQVDQIIIRTKKVTGYAKSNLRYQVRDLKIKFDIASRKLIEMKKREAVSWPKDGPALEFAWNEVNTAIKPFNQ